jgi:pullulanase/glycogen debranching enzyme
MMRSGEVAAGATWTGDGVSFGLFSANATAVELCLFDDGAPHELARIPLERRGDIWAAHVPGIGPGQLYGYRVTAPMSQKRATASIRTSCCSIPMRGYSVARSMGRRRLRLRSRL